MKKILLAFGIVIGLMACGDNSNMNDSIDANTDTSTSGGTGGMGTTPQIDEQSTTPSTDSVNDSRPGETGTTIDTSATNSR